VGGGPAGCGAAIAAARNGAKTVLVERYGHLGGMATGGQVLMIPQVFAGSEPWKMVGICQEIIDRCDALGGCMHPSKEEVGSSDPEVVRHWALRTFGMMRERVGFSAYFDQEILKCVLNDMVEEAGVKLFLHSWASRAIVDQGTVQGTTFESKSGRQAILGKITIDTTGDGDMFASAGAEFDGAIDRELRSSQLALVFRLGNVDVMKFTEFRQSEPDKHRELARKMEGIWSEEFKSVLNPGVINPYHMVPQATPRDDVIWVNNWVKGRSPINVEDLTWVEVNIRKAMLLWHDFVKKNFPGFEKSFIIDTASQLGTRGSRRLVGEHVVTAEELRAGKTYDDSIIAFRGRAPRGAEGESHTYIPYRSLVPVSMEGLLVAGRCYSSDPIANNMTNLIPHCIAMGQAAGTAAVLATKNKVEPRKVDYRMLQESLSAEGVSLPMASSTQSKS
jgi:hypothetical protein